MQVAEAWQGQSLEGVMQKRKSKLELEKENVAAAANASSTSAASRQQSTAPRYTDCHGHKHSGRKPVVRCGPLPSVHS